MPDRATDDARDLLGAYVLGAVDEEERARVERLLLEDSDARTELHALQLAAAWLANSGLRPPERVWDRIEAEIRADAGAARDPAAAPGPEPTPPARVSAATVLRPRRPRRVLPIAAGVVAVLVVTGALVAGLRGGGGGSRVASRLEVAARAAARDPAARTMVLRSEDGRFRAHVVMLPDGRGYLTGAHLPAARPGRTYQLWAITGWHPPVSVGLLGPEPTVHEFRVQPALSALAISNEPAKGSREPTTTPVVRGALS